MNNVLTNRSNILTNKVWQGIAVAGIIAAFLLAIVLTLAITGYQNNVKDQKFVSDCAKAGKDVRWDIVNSESKMQCVKTELG